MSISQIIIILRINLNFDNIRISISQNTTKRVLPFLVHETNKKVVKSLKSENFICEIIIFFTVLFIRAYKKKFQSMYFRNKKIVRKIQFSNLNYFLVCLYLHNIFQ